MSGNIYQHIIRKICLIGNKNVLPAYRNMTSKYKMLKNVFSHHVYVKSVVFRTKGVISRVLDVVFKLS